MMIQNTNSYEHSFANTFISKLPEEAKMQYFLGAPNNELCEYFDNNSILEEFQLKDLSFEECAKKITRNQKTILFRLIRLNSAKAMLELQNTPSLRYCLCGNELHDHLKTLCPSNPNLDISHVLAQIDKLESFIPQENLLKILLFIHNNPYKLLFEGISSRSQPHIRKFHAQRFGIPSDLHYNTETGALFVKLGFLGRGIYKIVKKRLCLSSPDLKLEAVAKQDVTVQELLMLNLAKGLPHVISLDNVEIYDSKKKQKHVLQTTSQLYNMGEMTNHLKSALIPYKEKLQICKEILIGILGLHGKNIIHRDIKPANIFLHKTLENGKMVIHTIVADLGLSCFNGKGSEIRGTPLYMPPEVLKQRDNPGKIYVDFSMDAWSAGLVIMEFFSKETPWDNFQTFEDLKTHCDKLDDWSFNPPPKEQNSIEYVSWKLMQPDLSKRMTIKEALIIVESLIDDASKMPNKEDVINEEKIIEKIS